jgi:hypothetical protein
MEVLMAKPNRMAGNKVKNSLIFLCCAIDIKNTRLRIHKTVPSADAASESGAHLQICTIYLTIETAITRTTNSIRFESRLKRNPPKKTRANVTIA